MMGRAPMEWAAMKFPRTTIEFQTLKEAGVWGDLNFGEWIVW